MFTQRPSFSIGEKTSTARLKLCACGLLFSACTTVQTAAPTPDSARKPPAEERAESDDEMAQRVIVLPHGPAAKRANEGPSPTPSILNDPDPVFVTAKVERSGEEQAATRIMIRDATRVFLGAQAFGSGWYFQQNPVRPTLVSAVYLDHHEKTIVEHDETSLRDLAIARGWNDVQAFGLAAAQLSKLACEGSASPQEIAGHPAKLCVETPSGTSSPALRVWWNAELALPLRFEDQQSTLEVLRIEKPSAEDLDVALSDPRVRYPNYRVIDSVDYLELKHEHHGDEGGH
jgi:hypothetical protein